MAVRIRSGRRRAFLLAGCAALAPGCISDERIADDWVAKASKREASAPLGGEALAQRKLDLDRSYRDLGHFLATLDGLHRRNDRNGLVHVRGVRGLLRRQARDPDARAGVAEPSPGAGASST